jgi:uncharacterized delta-60 repeat protein
MATPQSAPSSRVAASRPLVRTFWIRAALLAWAGISSVVHAQAIDPAFTPAFNEDVHVVAAYPGGRVLVGGDFWSVNGQALSGLVRLMPNGTLDPTFNVDITGPVLSLAVQLDGRILIGGNFDQVNGAARVNLARLNADGSLDIAFVPAVPDDDIELLAVQPDGAVLIAGRFDDVGGQPRSYLARLQANGALDTGFADPALDGAVTGIAVQPDGRIVLGGQFGIVHDEERSGLARLGANGNLDTSFADPDVLGSINALTLLDDGRVLFTGQFGTVHGQSRPFIARLMPDGQLDASFVDANLRGNVHLRHLQPLVDGTTMLAGDWRWGTGTGATRLGRILADGQQDTGYDAPVFDSLIYGMTVQTGGRTFAGGLFLSADGLPRSHMAAITTTDLAVDQLERDGGTVLWRREGAVPMLSAPPQLQVSADGITFDAHATMTESAEGWTASGVPETAIHVRTRGLLTDNAGLVEAVLRPNLVFENGFD